MAAPAPIVTRMNSHGWIFFVARRVSLLQSLSFSAKLHSQSSSAPRSVVMAGAGDPVATGLVESLARPGGNVTG
jgi:putative tryptophan/tyrosine transport system substrate-binding protein